MPNPSVALLRELGGDQLARYVVQCFLDSASELVRSIRQGLSRRSLAEVGFAAHTLGSSAAQLGYDDVRALCIEIETLADQGDSEPIPALFAKLEKRCAAAFEDLRSETGGQPCP